MQGVGFRFQGSGQTVEGEVEEEDEEVLVLELLPHLLTRGHSCRES